MRQVRTSGRRRSRIFTWQLARMAVLVVAFTVGGRSAQAQAATATALAVSAAGTPVTTVASGSVVKLTATVTSGGVPVTAGTVNFCNAAAAHCTDINLLGTAQLTPAGTAGISFVPGIGSPSYKAVFAGTKTDASSVSGDSTLAVTGTFPTTAAIASSGTAGNYTLTATVVGAVSSGAAPPTGTVSFLDTTNANYPVATATLGTGTLAQTFAPQVSYPAGFLGYAVAVGDFNGDGIPDLAVTNSGDTLSVLLGKGDGTFGALAEFGTRGDPVSVAVGDFNGDGIPDLAVANHTDNTVSVLLGNGNGTFQTQLTYFTGASPNSLAVGDFNGDGILDLAVANFGDGTVSILLGGGGGFALPVTYATGANPMSVAVGDFNGDGAPDLVVANNGGGTASVLLGKGDGTFGPQVTYPVGTNPDSVAVGDFNGDGILDLAVANSVFNTVSILLGNPNGTFQPQVTYGTGDISTSVAVADFNGDGIPDLAVTNLGDNTVSVLLGKGDGTFQPQVTYPTESEPASLAVGDFNGDGIPDLAVANSDSDTAGVSVLLNQLTETITATATGVYVVGPGNPGHLVEANYPGAGDFAASVSGKINLAALLIPTTLTLATTSPTTVPVGTQVTLTSTLNPYMAQGFTTDGEVVNFLITGLGPNEIPEATPLSGGVATLSLNLSAPGQITVASYYKGMDNAFDASQANNIVFNVQELTTTTLAVISAGAPVSSVASKSVVTLTAVVATGAGAVTTGTVNFCNAGATAGATDCTDINLVGTAQLNTDGNASISFVPGIGSHSYQAIFVGTTSGTSSVSAASTLTVTGTFATTTTIAASGTPGSYTLTASVAGMVSRAAEPGPTGTVSFLNTGNANYSLATAPLGAGTLAQSFAPEVSYATGLEPQSAAVGDFNRDGIPDLVVANGTGDTVSVLLGNANGKFQPQVTYATGSYSISVAVADFNGDGFLDLAVVNLVDNTVSVLLGNGDGTFQPQVTYATGSAPSSVAVGDFNGDGIIDLAVADNDEDSVSVFLGKGDGTFNAPVLYFAGGNPQFVAVGDFNGDGFPDLAVANYSGNSIAVLLGNGNGTFQTQVSYATGSNPYSEAVGDFNGDGVLDVAVANLDGESVSVLLGNGDGTFQPQVTYATGNLTYSVAVGDFNADGIPDLVAICNGADPVSLLLGKGDGTFQPPEAYAIGSGPQFVAVGDFNGDGVPDLAVVNTGMNSVSVLLNQLTMTATATAAGVAVTGTGMQNVEASYPGDANYGAGFSTTTPLTAQPVATTLSISASAANITFGQPATLTATLNPYTSQGYSTNGEPVTFMSNGVALGTAALQTGVATLITGALQGGSNQLAASYAGDTNFAPPAPGAESIVVNPAGQTITFGAIGTQVVGTPLTLTASSSSGLAVSFASSTIGVCTVAGNIATMLTIGTCSVVASQAGNGNYATATPVTQSFAVSGEPQTISFTGLPQLSVYAPGLAYALNGTATSGLAVSYSSTGPATLNGSTLTITGAGTVVVTASQAGNTMYAAATPVAQTTIVVLAPSIVSQPNIGVSGINPGQAATITVVAAGTPPLAYQWFQGMSSIATNPIAGAVNSSYTTPALTVATNYWVQVSNQGGVVDSATLLVYVNQPPVCTLSVVGTSTPLAVGAIASCTDPQNELLTAATINWGDGTSAPLTGNALTHTYSAAGTYTVVVTATNTSGLTGSARQQITPNQLPVCTLGIIQGTAATYGVSVPASCTDPQSEALTTTINWGDGTIAPATNNATNTHTYATNGTYTVILSGTDTSGLVGASAPQPVTVLVQATPIAPGGSAPVSGTAPPPPPAVVGTKVTFICSSVSTTLGGQTVNNALPSQYGISCTSPTITLTPAPTPINVTIQTTTSTTAAAEYRAADTDRVVCAVVFPLPGLALLLLGTISPSRRRRRRDQWLAIGMVAVLCFGLTSCGGSFTPPPVAATPEGQYYVTVVETVVNPPAPTGFVQTSLIVPLPVTSSAGN